MALQTVYTTMNAKDVEENVVLKGIQGLGSLGLDTRIRHREHIAIFIEPADFVFSGRAPSKYSHQTFDTLKVTTDADLIYTAFSYRMAIEMLITGNPVIHRLLWSPVYLANDSIIEPLLNIRNRLFSRRLGDSMMTYFDKQRYSIFDKNKRSSTYNEEIGYDPIRAMGLFRNALQTIEMMTQHQLSIPMRQEDIDALLPIGNGEVSYDKMIVGVDWVYREMIRAVQSNKIVLDHKKLSRLSADAHFEWYAKKGSRS